MEHALLALAGGIFVAILAMIVVLWQILADPNTYR